ncbi:MAG: 50S ribosomal protein L29 [Victivallaceae bacterium]|nr:50S ribosomal protein L29 [Victivallaceae bacterium]MDD4180313.1 50S ribosomal protein L29 [Victivallaceae bacterium]
MKNNEIKQMTDAELNSQINELRREKLNLTIQSRSGQLTKFARVREVRRDVARIETEKTARLTAKING